MKIKIFKGKKKVVYSLLAATILSSSVASAASYNFPNVTYGKRNNNRGYTITYYYNIGKNNNNNRYENNNNSNDTIAEYPNWTWTIINTKPKTRPGTVVELPNKPSNPAPSTPSNPTTPSNPSTPSNPTNPSRPTNPKPAEPTTPAPSTPEISGLSEFEAEVVRLVNIERQKAGLQPLQASVELSNVARKKSEDMAKNNYFSHTSPTYGSPFDMMKSFGIKYNTAGENIAKGQLSPQSVVNAWMNSSGHRANILNPSFNKIGVGHYKSSNGTNYWTQMFTN